MRSAVFFLLVGLVCMNSVYTTCKDTCFDVDSISPTENTGNLPAGSNQVLIQSNYCQECNTSMYAFLIIIKWSIPLTVFGSLLGSLLDYMNYRADHQ